MDETQKPPQPENKDQENPGTEAVPTPNTASMEVHHHAHAEAHTGQKRAKHYFFEFFMLFLAVFAGSVAEYYLEHVIEIKREKQYIESMVEDLRIDTVNLNNIIEQNKEKVCYLDTLISILDTAGKIIENPQNSGMLYIFNTATLHVSTMEFSTRTISQLKNAGNMRLIHDVKVSDSIMNYDQYIQHIAVQQKAYVDLSMDIIKEGMQLFDSRFFRGKGINSNEDFMKQHLKLLTNDTLKLIEYDNMIDMNRGVIKGYKHMLENQKDRAKNLIIFLKKKYSL